MTTGMTTGYSNNRRNDHDARNQVPLISGRLVVSPLIPAYSEVTGRLSVAFCVFTACYTRKTVIIDGGTYV